MLLLAFVFVCLFVLFVLARLKWSWYCGPAWTDLGAWGRWLRWVTEFSGYIFSAFSLHFLNNPFMNQVLNKPKLQPGSCAFGAGRCFAQCHNDCVSEGKEAKERFRSSCFLNVDSILFFFFFFQPLKWILLYRPFFVVKRASSTILHLDQKQWPGYIRLFQTT